MCDLFFGAIGRGTLGKIPVVDHALVTVVVPLLPIALQLRRSVEAHRAASDDSGRSRDEFNALWEQHETATVPVADLRRRAERLQAGFYDRRRRPPTSPRGCTIAHATEARPVSSRRRAGA